MCMYKLPKPNKEDVHFLALVSGTDRVTLPHRIEASSKATYIISSYILSSGIFWWQGLSKCLDFDFDNFVVFFLSWFVLI